MTHPIFHAQSSVRRFGGRVEDYQPIHDWLDATKETFCDFRHRALRHHSHGVFEAERLFGATIRNSDGALVPTRYWRSDTLKKTAAASCRRYPIGCHGFVRRRG
jgi:hypothetical protein